MKASFAADWSFFTRLFWPLTGSGPGAPESSPSREIPDTSAMYSASRKASTSVIEGHGSVDTRQWSSLVGDDDS